MKVQIIEAVKKCVMNNLGPAVVPSYSVLEELKSGSLVPVKTELDEKRYNSIYVNHKNKWISPQIELALNLIKKYISNAYHTGSIIIPRVKYIITSRRQKTAYSPID